MNRRAFLGTVAGGLLAAPLAAEGQSSVKVPRLGYLASDLVRGPQRLPEAFRQGLRELGYVEGRNLVIEYRDAEGKLERLPALAAELVALKVDVIFCPGTQHTMAARQATTTVPIVFADIDDPISRRLVASLARPGGNVTGLANLNTDIFGKRLELLKQTVPGFKQAVLLWQPSYLPQRAKDDIHKQAESSARAQGVQLKFVAVEKPDELETAFADMGRARVGGVIVFGGIMMILERARIAELAARNGVPATYPMSEFVDAGGLMSYAPNVADNFRRAAGYVDKILKGTKPADLPVEQTAKLELVINLKTAKALGLTIPPAVLARADQVIE